MVLHMFLFLVIPEGNPEGIYYAGTSRIKTCMKHRPKHVRFLSSPKLNDIAQRGDSMVVCHRFRDGTQPVRRLQLNLSTIQLQMLPSSCQK